MTTDANTGASFNRYSYTNNGPYSYLDPDGRDTYRVNRDLRVFGSSARSINDPISHTLTATTDSTGNVVHTYSWGNDANLKGWNIDQPLDMITASEAIKNDLAEKVGDSKLDPFVAKEFENLNKKENEHSNHIVTDNCKTETTKLINGAKQAQEGLKNPPEPKKPDPLRPSERPGRE